MEISALQKARYEYAPKLPGMLRHGIADICVKEGEETQSVADQEKIKALFPNTYGKKEITFQKGANTSVAKKQVVGVILSGGQAPGGHNVICGLLYDEIFAIGPMVMMKFVCKTTAPYGMPTTVSMSPIMIDGTGMCGGCRLTVGGETKFACVDGPDFDGQKVDWDLAVKRNQMYHDFEVHKHEEVCNLFKKEVK